MASFSTLDDDLVVSVASYGAPEDLLNLALTCRRLGSKMGGATRREWRALARDAKRKKTSLREWSLVEEAARSAMQETQTVEERACLPLRDRDSWMARYHELIMLRRPLTFDQLFGDEVVVSNDKTKVSLRDAGGGYNTALSNNIMRSGKHYVSFTRTGSDIRVGVFRPTKGLKTKRLSYIQLIEELNNKWWDAGDVTYCALNLSSYFTGNAIWAGKGRSLAFTDWQGQESFRENDTAGLLLDLDEGTLSVYRNGRRLGVVRSGFAGEYCWGVSLSDDSLFREAPPETVKISGGAIPG